MVDMSDCTWVPTTVDSWVYEMEYLTVELKVGKLEPKSVGRLVGYLESKWGLQTVALRVVKLGTR